MRRNSDEASRMKVLIADDSATVRDRLKEALSEVGGIEIAGEAATADDAVRMAENISPGVIILDIRMPGGSGIEALRRIKNRSPETVVIMFTNFPGEQYRKACLLAGADFFYDKSMDQDNVIRICRELCDGS